MKDLFELSEKEQIVLLQELHYTNSLSAKDIAEKYNTYTNKVRRLATKLGFKMRGKSEAQALVLSSGKVEHPTKGKERPQDVKMKIGRKTKDYWENLSEDDLAERSRVSKENWEKISDNDKAHMLDLATKARLKTAKDGSKLEKAILEKLIEAGYYVEFHKEHSLLNERLQLDMFIPKLRVALEIDGPTHDENIWGEEYLRKTKERDNQKNGLVFNAGCVMIRVKQTKDISLTLVEDLSIQLLTLLDSIKKDFPPVGKRLFIIN